MVGFFFFREKIRQKGFYNKLPVAAWCIAILIISSVLWSDFSVRTNSTIEQLRNFYGTLSVTEENVGSCGQGSEFLQ